jgi:hypothetical protein
LSVLADGLAATFIVLGAIAFVVVIGRVILSFTGKLRSPRRRTAVLVGLVLFSALETGVIGPWVWARGIRATEPRRYLNADQWPLESLAVPRTDEAITLPLNSTFSVGIKPNWYFDRYAQFLEMTGDEPGARRRFLGVLDGRRLYFSQAIGYTEIQAFLDDAAHFQDCERVVSYTGDALVVDVRAPADGYLSFIDNWDPDWEATVDGRSTQIELLFGTFKSVQLPAGEHRVTFAYRPRFFHASE